MKTIWKYKLSVTGRLGLSIPVGGEVLTVQNQGGGACIWVLVDPNMYLEERWFAFFGTGHPIQDVDSTRYIGTLQQGPFVWHLFEVDK